MIKNLPAMWETQDRSLDCEDPLEKGMKTHSRILAWRIPWKEEPGGLQSMRPQRVKQDPFPFACIILGFSSGSTVKESTCSAGMQIRSLGQEDPLGKGMATHSRILAWRIPWTEEPGKLQFVGSQRVGCDSHFHFSLSF